MSQSEPIDQSDIILPASIVSKIDVSRLLSELEMIDNDMTSAGVRSKVGVDTDATVSPSEQMSDFLSANQLELGDSNLRSRLLSALRSLKDEMPVIHMTFAAPADYESLQEIVGWLRQSIHPQAVISVGLQPGLVGGAFVRTTNHVHDMSVRAQLAEHRDTLISSIKELSGEKVDV